MRENKCGQVLVASGDPRLLETIQQGLPGWGYETWAATNMAGTSELLRWHHCDILLLDLAMPQADGSSMLQQALEYDPQLVVIVVSAHDNCATPGEAMQQGAFDWLSKPVELGTLEPLLTRAMEVRRLRKENADLRAGMVMHELTQELVFPQDLNTLLGTVAEAALSQCRADEVSILLPTQDGSELYVAAALGEDRAQLLGQRMPIAAGVAGWVAQQHESLVLQGPVQDQRFVPLQPREGINSSMVLPLLAAGHLRGVLCVNATRPGRHFTPGEVESLRILTGALTRALESNDLFHQLQGAERKYRLLFDNAIDGMFQTDARGTFISVNQALACLLGYATSVELLQEMGGCEEQLAVNRERRNEMLGLLNNYGEVRGFEMEVYRRDRSIITVSINARRVPDESGRVLYHEGLMRDITERKAAERAVHRAPTLTAMGMVVLSIMLMTVCAAEVIFPPPNWGGNLLISLVSTCIVLTGMHWTLSRQERAHRGVIEAVSARRLAEADLLWQKSLLEAQSEATIDGILVVDPEGQVLFRNQRFHEMWDIPLELRSSLDDRELLQAVAGKIKDAPAFLRQVKFLYEHPDLTSRDLIYLVDGRVLDRYSAPVKSPGGERHGRIWIFRDITEHVEAQSGLRDREEHFRAVFERSCVGKSISSPEGILLDVNASLAAMLGYDPADLVGHSCWEFNHPEDAGRSEQELRRLLREGGSSYRTQKSYLHRDGHRIWVDESCTLLRTSSGEPQHLITTVIDITERKQAEAALAHERDFIAAVLNTAGSLIIVLDDTGRIVRFNRACENLTGYAADEVLHQNYEFLIPEGERVSVAARLADVMQGEFPCVHENHWRTRAGLQRLLSWSNSALTNERGEVEFIIGIGTDITESKLVEQEMQRLNSYNRSLIEAGLDPIIAVDPDGAIMDVNLAAEVLSGYSRQQTIGTHFSRYFSDPTSVVEGFRQVFRDGAVRDFPLEVRHRNGTKFQVLVNATLFSFTPGEVAGVLAVARDMTEHHKAEERLRRAYEELEDRVTERTAELSQAIHELSQAKEDADRANRAKSDFLSRMSHELRTPLNSILGFAQLLEMQGLTPLQQEEVRHILDGGKHLLELINEVLDIARIETGRLSLSLEPVELDTLISECISLVLPMALEKKISCEHTSSAEGKYIQADVQRFRQVLLNLLSNAIKYNVEGGLVTVAVSRSADKVLIEVTDTGCGIDAADMPRLFQPFERLQSGPGAVEGTGIGLALSRGLVEAMEGEMGATSRPGEGSTFWIKMPVPPAAGESAGAGLVAREAAAATLAVDCATVLYIEDNLSNIRLIESVLKRLPEVRLMTAMQGSVGLDMARQHCPDLILLDVHLPDLSGEDVLQRLRASDITRDIPVIVISADATARQQDKMLRLGARSYLTKPLDIKAMLQELRREIEAGKNNI